MFLTRKDISLLGVAAIALVLAFGVYANAPAILAQESGVVDNFTDVVVPDSEPQPETQVAPAQDGTDLALTNVETLIAAISTLIGTGIAIVSYVINAIRARTGDKIISNDFYNKYVSAIGVIEQKDAELRDAYRQVLEEKEIIKLGFNALKGVSPDIAAKLEAAEAKANEKIQTEILPQINEWQVQADRKYETLLNSKPVRS